MAVASFTSEGGGAVPRHLALYRAWRPTTFAEVVGQNHVTTTLRNALIQGRLGHAYLFCGPRGTGKTSVAKILARAANCLQLAGGEPCNACAACRSVLEGRAIDVLEIDAASHRGIDEIRDLREKARYTPAALRVKVYIVDEVHMLTQEAFNALLKTLEEPPAHVLYILATTDPKKIPSTIISRCQRFEFHRLSTQEVVGRLGEVCAHLGVQADGGVLEEIARHAEGGLRDALSILDQSLAFAGRNLDLEHVRQLLGSADVGLLQRMALAILEHDALTVLGVIEEVNRLGRDLRQFARDLLMFFRDLLLTKVNPSSPTGLMRSEHGEPGLASVVQAVPVARLLAVLKALARVEGDLRWAGQPRLVLEVSLLALVLDDPGATGADAPPRRPIPTVAGAVTQPAPAPVRQRVPAPASVVAPTRAEQAAAAAPAFPAPGAGESRAGRVPTLEEVRTAWKAVTERVKRERRQLHALLDPARPVAVRGSEIVLQFGRAYGFHHDRVSDAQHRSFLEKVIAETLGTPLSVRCVLGDEQEAPPPGPVPGVATGRDADTGVLAAMEILGGRLVELDVADGHYEEEG